MAEERRRTRVRAARRSLARRIAEGESYGLLLIGIVLTYTLVAVSEGAAWSQVVLAASFGSTLLLALHTSHVRGRGIRIAAGVVVGLVTMNFVLALLGDTPVRAASYVIAVLLVIAPFVVLVRIFRHPVINIETVLGAIDAYLLVGIAFATVYFAMNDVSNTDFFVQGEASRLDFLYFSFVTLTTTGFGDFTAAQPYGKVIVTFEALFGQLFLVTVVAVLVSNLGRERGRPPVDEDAAEELDPSLEPESDDLD